MKENEVIAKFMEYKEYVDIGMGVRKGMGFYIHNDGTITHADKLFYHTSWDWLMPVVEKIEAMGFVVKIHLGSCFIITQERFISGAGKEYLGKHQDNNKLKSVYLAIIQFITWYNNQPPNF